MSLSWNIANNWGDFRECCGVSHRFVIANRADCYHLDWVAIAIKKCGELTFLSGWRGGGKRFGRGQEKFNHEIEKEMEKKSVERNVSSISSSFKWANLRRWLTSYQTLCRSKFILRRVEISRSTLKISLIDAIKSDYRLIIHSVNWISSESVGSLLTWANSMSWLIQ